MDIILVLLLFAFALGGWLLLFLGLPGTLVIVLSAGVYALARDFSGGDRRVLGILLIYALVAEGLEFAVFYWQSKKSKLPTDVIIAGIIGGLMGAVVGFPIPVLGPLIGVFLGVFGGTFLFVFWKSRKGQEALRLAKSALISRALSVVAKVMVGALMLIYLVLQFI